MLKAPQKFKPLHPVLSVSRKKMSMPAINESHKRK